MPTAYGILYKNGVNYSHNTAESISYDNTTSGLSSTNVQDAIDEIAPHLVPTGGTSTKYLKDNGTWGTIPNTTYTVVTSVVNDGLVPSGGTSATYLRADGSWETPPNATYAVMASGTTGLVPTGGDTTKFLRGDATWQTTAAFNTTYPVVNATTNGLAPSGGSSAKYLRADGTWQTTAAFNSTFAVVTTAAAGRMPTGGSSANYLRGNGTYGTPPDSDNMVKQVYTTASGSYRVLLSESGYNTNDEPKKRTRKYGLNFSPSAGQMQFYDQTNKASGYVRPGYFYLRNTTAQFIHGNSDASLTIRASDESSFGVVLGIVGGNTWCFRPVGDNNMTLGSASYKWSVLYATLGSINTSDRNLKKDIEELGEQARAFIMDLKPVSYKYKNTKEVKHNHDRTHYGLIAQDVEETMNKMGMTALDFAGFCKDQKMEEYETFSLKDDGTPYKDADGNNQVITEQRPIEGEYIYALRYEEFISPIIKTLQLQRIDIDKQQSELEELKSRLDKLENK